MSALREHLRDYLALRRGLGFKLERPGQLLAGLVGYLDAAGAPTVTTWHALAWATAPAARTRPGGGCGWRRSARSHGTWCRSSPGPRSRRAGCCPARSPAGRCPTCIQAARSPR